MRLISLTFSLAYCVGGSFEEAAWGWSSDLVDFGKVFDEEGEYGDTLVAESIPPIRGAYMKYTQRHLEIVSEIVASEGDSGISLVSMFDKACEKIKREGLASMPFGTFYTYARRMRSGPKRSRDEAQNICNSLKKRRSASLVSGESSGILDSSFGAAVQGKEEIECGSSSSSSAPKQRYSKEQIEILEQTIKLHPEMGLQDLYEIFQFFEAVAKIETGMKYSTFCSRATRIRTHLRRKIKNSGRCKVGHYVSGLLHQIIRRCPDISPDQAREQLIPILHGDEIPATNDISSWLRYHRDHMIKQLRPVSID